MGNTRRSCGCGIIHLNGPLMNHATDQGEWRDALFAWLERSRTTEATFNEFVDLAERLKNETLSHEEFLAMGKRVLEVGEKLGTAFSEQFAEMEELERRKEALQASRLAYIARFRQLFAELLSASDDGTLRQKLNEILPIFEVLRNTPFISDQEKSDTLERVAETLDTIARHKGAPAGLIKSRFLEFASTMDSAHGMYTGGQVFLRPGMPTNLFRGTAVHELIHSMKGQGLIVRDVPIASAAGYYHRWSLERKAKTYEKHPLDDWPQIEAIIKTWRPRLSDKEQRAAIVDALLQHYDQTQSEDRPSYLAGIIVAAAVIEEFPDGGEPGMQYLGELARGATHEIAVVNVRRRKTSE
jgi:hypothetical protein